MLDINLIEYSRCTSPVPLPYEVAQTMSTRLHKYLDISPAWHTSNAYWLTARQYVGDIVVADVHIRIQSNKASMVNLFWMLTYAYDLPEFRSEVTNYQTQNSLLEFLVAIFARQVERLVRQGIVRNYQNRQANQTRIRGRLLIAQQLRDNLIHPERFAVRWAEHTSDVLENQLLKYIVLRLASVRYSDQHQLNHKLRKLYAAFDQVTYRTISQQDFDGVSYNQLNQRYRGPLALARLLWQHLGLRNEAGQVLFSTYLFDLNDLFERFIAAYLNEMLPQWNLNTKAQHRIMLDQHHLERAAVDVVLMRDRRPVLALDTKYKTYQDGPARHDLNQMFVYCHTLGLNRGILLYPSHDKILKDRRVMAKATLDILSIPLGGDLTQFRTNLQSLADELQAIATSEEAS